MHLRMRLNLWFDRGGESHSQITGQFWQNHQPQEFMKIGLLSPLLPLLLRSVPGDMHDPNFHKSDSCCLTAFVPESLCVFSPHFTSPQLLTLFTHSFLKHCSVCLPSWIPHYLLLLWGHSHFSVAGWYWSRESLSVGLRIWSRPFPFLHPPNSFLQTHSFSLPSMYPQLPNVNLQPRSLLWALTFPCIFQ